MVQGSELPYFPISQFYRDHFGAKVFKVSVAVADTCPNREGLKGMQTCNFCDQWGSAAYAKNLSRPLSEQIESVRKIVQKHRKAEKFLVYFQAYTTTFAKVAKLREQFELALSLPDVVGLVVGTRPDCVSQAFLDLCNEMSERTFMAVEMGVQSFDNEVLRWMRRGHTREQSLRAIDMIHRRCPKVNLGIHLIFGNPGESVETARLCAEECNALPIHNVKLHNMHVLKGTALADEYGRGEFQPMSRDDYYEMCKVFLQHLRPDMAVHRLSAFSSRPDELIAPDWTAYKMKTYQNMLEYLRAHSAFQGQLYRPLAPLRLPVDAHP